jgi:hypothetical protein
MIVLHVLFWYGLPLFAIALIVLLLTHGGRWFARRLKPGEGGHVGLTAIAAAIGTCTSLFAGTVVMRNSDHSGDVRRAVALVTILMLPAVLAIIGLRRPAALFSAGVISIPMPLMSFSFLLFPMLIPAALYLAAYAEAPKTHARIPAPFIAGITFALFVLSFLALFRTDDPVCFEMIRHRDGSTSKREVSSSASAGYGPRVVSSGCSSDSVTLNETGSSLALVMAAGILVGYLSGPRTHGRSALDANA